MKRGAELKRTPFARSEPKPAKGPKLKKCAICRAPFQPRSMTHKACGPDCSQTLMERDKRIKQSKAQRQERAEDKAKLEAMKPAKWWKSKAKTAMHLYVRTRDAGKPCASCDTILLQLGRPGGDYDAGHFRSVGSAKHLEFDERNVFGQCKHCNDHLKGNQLEYERRLRLLKGDKFVDELRADNAGRHYKIADYQEIEQYYKAKLLILKETS